MYSYSFAQPLTTPSRKNKNSTKLALNVLVILCSFALHPRYMLLCLLGILIVVVVVVVVIISFFLLLFSVTFLLFCGAGGCRGSLYFHFWFCACYTLIIPFSLVRILCMLFLYLIFVFEVNRPLLNEWLTFTSISNVFFKHVYLYIYIYISKSKCLIVVSCIDP